MESNRFLLKLEKTLAGDPKPLAILYDNRFLFQNDAMRTYLQCSDGVELHFRSHPMSTGALLNPVAAVITHFKDGHPMRIDTLTGFFPPLATGCHLLTLSSEIESKDLLSQAALPLASAMAEDPQDHSLFPFWNEFPLGLALFDCDGQLIVSNPSYNANADSALDLRVPIESGLTAAIQADFRIQNVLAQELLNETLRQHRFLQGMIIHFPNVAFSALAGGDYPLTFFSPNMDRIGLDPSQYLPGSTSLLGLVHPEDFPAVRRHLQRGLSKMSSVVVYFRLGEDVHVKCSGHFRVSDGQTIFEGVFEDISQQMELRRKIQESRHSLQRRLDDIARTTRLERGFSLTNSVSLETMQSHLERIARTFGVTAGMVDSLGNPFWGVGCACCQYLHRADFGPEACLLERIRMIQNTAEQPGQDVVICQLTGLSIVFLPILLDEQPVAYCYLGPFRVSKPDDELVRKTCATLGLSPEPMLKTLNQIPCHSPGLVNQAIATLRLFSNLISLFGYRNAILMQCNDSAHGAKRIAEAQSRRQLLINQVLEILYASPNLEDALSHALEHVIATLGYSRGYIYERLGDAPIALTTECSHPHCAPIPRRWRSESPFEVSLDSGLTILEGECLKASQMSEYAAAAGARTIAYRPIVSEGRLMGIVALDDCRMERIYFPEDKEQLEALMLILGNALCSRQSLQQTRYSLDAMRYLVENVDPLVYAVDLQSYVIVFANEKCARVFGFSPEEMLGKVCWQVLNPDGQSPCDFCPRQKSWFEKSSMELETVEARFHGRWYRSTHSIAPWIDGRLIHLVSSVDISQDKEREALIRDMAYRDSLTGIYNRRKLDLDMEAVLPQPNSSGYLLFLDLDDFKFINDTYGHEEGDSLLKMVAYFLNALPDAPDAAYRLGGDEFMLFLPDVSPERLDGILAGLMERFRQSWPLSDGDRHCTVSVGISRFPHDGFAAHKILRNADVAMYKAKNSGKNSYAFFSDNVTSDAHEQILLEAQLRAAAQVDMEDFVVDFRPIASAATGKTIGLESSCYWNHPIHGKLHGERLLTLAVATGLTRALGSHFLLKALCEFAAPARETPGFLITMEMWMHLMRSETLLSTVQQALDATGFPANCLLFVFSEPGTSVEALAHTAKLAALRELGCKIAVHNVGTTTLLSSEEPVFDYLRLDAAFGSSVTENSFSDTFVVATTMLAHSIGVAVAIDGIERPDQMEFVRKNGIDLIQGSYLSGPLSAADARRFLASPT